MQADLGIDGPKQYRSTWGTARALHAEGGVPLFWKGLVPRSLRCIGAVFILGQANWRLSALFNKWGVLM